MAVTGPACTHRPRHFREALRLDPGIGEIHSNLGVALAAKGKTDDAIRHYQEALRLNPGDAKARKNLDIALAQRE